MLKFRKRKKSAKKNTDKDAPQSKPEPTQESAQGPTEESAQEQLTQKAASISQEDSPRVAKEDNTSTSAELEKKAGFLRRLRTGLGRTRSNLSEGVTNLVLGRKEIDEELLEEIEEQLLLADVGVDASQEIIDDLTMRVKRKELNDAQALLQALCDNLTAMLAKVSVPLQVDASNKPYVILMVGVNGNGKTTTIGKLAKHLQAQGKQIMLAAGDTFRAAAIEQLQVWGERNQIPVVAQKTGSDSASVLYDALQSAKAREVDVLIADTAGRLHTQSNLMEELKKIKRVMAKLDGDAPHEIMLVLDAATGQNALNQAQQFHDAVGVTGLTLTKLDGTAKGGIIFALANSMEIPIRFIGIGEGIEDLRPFSARDFVEALFSENDTEVTIQQNC